MKTLTNSNFLSRVQILSLPRTPPPQWKTLTFFLEFRSELTQNTPPIGGWSMWRLYPLRIPSRCTCITNFFSFSSISLIYRFYALYRFLLRHRLIMTYMSVSWNKLKVESCRGLTCHVKLMWKAIINWVKWAQVILNKYAFQYDAYHPIWWLPLDVSPGESLSRGSLSRSLSRVSVEEGSLSKSVQGGSLSRGVSIQSEDPLWTEWQTGVKTLLSGNFGKNIGITHYSFLSWIVSQWMNNSKVKPHWYFLPQVFYKHWKKIEA